MALTKVQLKPGYVTDGTAYANKGGWSTGNRVRFRLGYPESIGGWSKYSNQTYVGSCRALINWSSRTNEVYLGIATNIKLYLEQDNLFNDITPIRATNVVNNPFDASVGSYTLTVTDPNHAASAGDYVTFSGADALDYNNMLGYIGTVSVVGTASSAVTGVVGTGSVGTAVASGSVNISVSINGMTSFVSSVSVSIT